MTLFGTPDGLLSTGENSFRIVECKARMGSGKADQRFIKDYLQAVSYQILYNSDARPQETILLSHFELAKTGEERGQLTLEHKTLSQWFLKDMMQTPIGSNSLDTEMFFENNIHKVRMASESQAGLLQVLHICASDAEAVWAEMMCSIWMLLTVVLTIANDEEWQREWFSARDKSVFLHEALQRLPVFYGMDKSVHA